jgi:hypothetical protein
MMDSREESLRQLFNDLTDKTFVDFKYYKLEFNDIALDLLKFLLLSTMINNNQVSIGLIYDKGIKCSYLTLDRFNMETMLHLKLYANSIFKIELTYWISGEVCKGYKYKLKKNNLEFIPEGLINIMKDVFQNEKPVTVNSNSIQHKK